MKFVFETIKELVDFLNIIMEHAVSIDSGKPNPNIYYDFQHKVYKVEIGN